MIHLRTHPYDVINVDFSKYKYPTQEGNKKHGPNGSNLIGPGHGVGGAGRALAWMPTQT